MSRHLLLSALLLVALASTQEPGRQLHSSSDSPPEPTESANPRPVATPGLALEAAAPKSDEPTREEEIRSLFEQKRFDEVLAIIKEDMQKTRNESYRLWLQRQLATVKTALAFHYLGTQNCNKALEIIEEIPDAERPDLASKGVGYCKLLAKDWLEADAYLSVYLQSRPDDSEARTLLVQAKEAQGLYEEALDVGAAASEGLSPKQTASLEAKRDESLRQLQTESGVFRLSYPPHLSPDFVERVVDTLNRTAALLNSEFGIDYPSKTIDVQFYPEERFGEMTHGPSWAVGFYDGIIRLPLPEPASWTDAIARTIRHELTHALISESVGRRSLPSWFQEGFAQLAECESLCLSYSFAATTRGFLPQDRLNGPFGELDTREAQLAYKQSLYMTILLYKLRGSANLKQMFSLMPGLDELSTDTLIEQTGFSASELFSSAENAWKTQRSF